MKRKRPKHEAQVPIKRSKCNGSTLTYPYDRPSEPAVLQLYYAQLCTLREYLLSQLSHASKSRRRRILNYGLSHADQKAGRSADDGLASLLDRIIVGKRSCTQLNLVHQDQELQVFSQQLSESSGRSSISRCALSFPEVSLSTVLTRCKTILPFQKASSLHMHRCHC